MDRHSQIFRPITIGRFTTKNRIQVAPAGPFLAGHDGGNSPEFMAYTKGLAKSGAGIVTLGVSAVDETVSGVQILSVGSPIFIPDLADITELIHQYGALASIELINAKYMLTPPHIVATETTKEEIKQIITSFANAAERCLLAGFDMIMIHGGHGNVPSMFFSEEYNKRTDEYGGSFLNRCRFTVELLEAVRAKVGNNLAIEYRISAEELLPGSTGIEETLAFAKVIQDKIDLLHVSRGLLEVDSLLPFIFQPTYFPRAMNLEAAKRFKQELDIPVSVVGSFDLETAENAVANGDVDIVAMIRNVLADTDCVSKAYRGKTDTIRPCVRCNTCIHRTHSQFIHIRCAVNPLIGRETWFPELEPKLHTKKVVIIGGGPAGLEAARVASARGHQVVLYEKGPELGGVLRMASVASFKKDMKSYLDWSIRTVRNDPKIMVRLNTEATRENILLEDPDALLIAVGAKPIIPAFTASSTGKVVWVGDVELGKAKIGQNVIIAGAGFTGLELALTLAGEGKDVTVIDMLPEEKIGADGIHISMIALRKLLIEAGVKFRCEVKLLDVTEEGAILSTKDNQSLFMDCDQVILSLGVKADTSQVEEFSDLVEETYVIGDCGSKGGTLWNATRTGFDAAIRL